MRTVLLIYILAAILALPKCAQAFSDDDYVDWPTSVSGKSHTLRISIDGCISLFKVEDKNLEKFTKDKQSLKEVMAKAIERSKNGCK